MSYRLTKPQYKVREFQAPLTCQFGHDKMTDKLVVLITSHAEEATGTHTSPVSSSPNCLSLSYWVS